MFVVLAVVTLCALLVFGAFAYFASSPSSGPRPVAVPVMSADLPAGCREIGPSHQLCIASDMARQSRRASFSLEHAAFDFADGQVELHAARNETVAFQLLIRSVAKSDVAQSVRIKPIAWRSASSPQPVKVHQSLFHAHYLQIDNGGYTWGPPTRVMPWPAAYPDALIPTHAPCEPDQPLLSEFPLASEVMQNQAVWIDTFVPESMPAGVYHQEITIEIGEHRQMLTVHWQVHDVMLPNEPTIEAVGEIYLAYSAEGAGMDIGDPQWQSLAQCYQQLAHQHRMVFIERFPKGLPPQRQADYVKTFGPALTGGLFTAERGYVGPGRNTPVTVWRPPWPQRIDMSLNAPLGEEVIAEMTRMASDWQALVLAQGWHSSRYFAYVFDEVDGPPAAGVSAADHRQYVAMTHEQMGRVQQAIDAGSTELAIDLIWTSHANPAQWADDPALDLTDKIRFWAPNASAADPDFLHQRMKLGETAWFYHSGHPAIGAHGINASGIEMRTWGVVGARYGFDGQFMWAVNLGSQLEPYAQPSYKPGDDRVGNGVLVYPGHQLSKLAGLKLPSAPGPVPSMRLKAWRRGLQDAELFQLARERSPESAQALIEALVPRALADGAGGASWPDDPARWVDFRLALLSMASE
ncbi:MAG: DUF4091 domain-containing protein [Burkholderiaceae bacterium]